MPDTPPTSAALPPKCVRTFHEYLQGYQPRRYAALRQTAEYLHAEHHEGVIVPTLASCNQAGHNEQHYIDLVLALEECHVIPRT